MPNLLLETDITGVHLVGKTATGRKWLIAKARTTTTEEETVSKEELLKAFEGLDEKERDAFLKNLGVEVPTEETIVQKVLKALKPDKPEESPIKDEEVRKAVESLTKNLEDEKSKREELEKKLADREEEDRQREALKKAEDLKDLGFTAEDAKVLADTPDAVVDKLRAFKNQKDVAALFTELGKGGGEGGSDAESQIIAKAKEIRKANPGMSYEEAEGQAWEENPELYAEFLKENPVQ